MRIGARFVERLDKRGQLPKVARIEIILRDSLSAVNIYRRDLHLSLQVASPQSRSYPYRGHAPIS